MASTNKLGFRTFRLERYLADHEFSAPFLLCASDCQPLTVKEVLAFADADSRARWDGLSLAYTESQGLPELRSEISKIYQSVPPENCLVMVPEEAIFLGMRAILHPGDHVIVTYPGYQSLFENARALGCNLSYWKPLCNASGQWIFDYNDYLALMQTNTKALVVNFPHNPTGATLQTQDWTALHSLCHSKGITVFSDEMYRFLEHSADAVLPPATDLNPSAVVLGGMSKSFAMPGIRVGWLASRNAELISQVKDMKDFTTICNSAPSEVLALMGLRNKDGVLDRSRGIIATNMKLLDEFFAKHADKFEWHRPAAGSVTLVRLKTGESAEDFCTRCIKDAGVLLAPDTMFDLDGTGTTSHSFRLGCGRMNLGDCLQKLDAYLMQTAKEG